MIYLLYILEYNCQLHIVIIINLLYDNNEVNFMNNEKFLEILKNIENRSDISSEQIPSLDLYIDQIMTLFEVELSDNKRYEDDKVLTKTMVNNYSKAGILKPIKGKKYSKEHILQMLLIYSLKNTISISEIKKVLQPYHNSNESIEPIYEEFLNEKNDLTKQITNALNTYIDSKNLDLNDPKQLTVTLLLICAISNQFKSIAESMLDTYYKE